MKYVWKTLGIYLAFLIQSLIFENLKIFSSSPDLLIAVVIIMAVSEDFVPASVLGAFAGLLIDVMYGQAFGINILLYMYLALIVSIASNSKSANSPLIMSWVCFVSVAATEILVVLLKAAMGWKLTAGQICANIFVKGVFAAVFALCAVLVVQYFKNRKKTEKTDDTDSGKEEAE